MLMAINRSLSQNEHVASWPKIYLPLEVVICSWYNHYIVSTLPFYYFHKVNFL
jgi:hypothetical protein